MTWSKLGVISRQLMKVNQIPGYANQLGLLSAVGNRNFKTNNVRFAESEVASSNPQLHANQNRMEKSE